MDELTPIPDISGMSLEARIALLQALWDSITAESAAPVASDPAETSELDLRLADLRTNPEGVLTWDRVKARVLGGSPS